MIAQAYIPAAADLGGALAFAVLVIVGVAVTRWVLRGVFARGHWVYEIDLADGTLWYIGESADLVKRMHRHETFQRGLPDGHPRKWWEDIDPEVHRTYMPTRSTWYSSKEVAKQIERQRVRSKNPPGNRIKYKGVMSGGE